MLTKEEIFTKVKNHLLSQNERAVGPAGTCMYRTPTGLKCAVGCLINSYIDTAPFENIAVTSQSDKAILLRQALKDSGVDIYDPDILYLLKWLQSIHDRCPPEEWKELLESCSL